MVLLNLLLFVLTELTARQTLSLHLSTETIVSTIDLLTGKTSNKPNRTKMMFVPLFLLCLIAKLNKGCNYSVPDCNIKHQVFLLPLRLLVFSPSRVTFITSYLIIFALFLPTTHSPSLPGILKATRSNHPDRE